MLSEFRILYMSSGYTLAPAEWPLWRQLCLVLCRLSSFFLGHSAGDAVADDGTQLNKGTHHDSSNASTASQFRIWHFMSSCRNPQLHLHCKLHYLTQSNSAALSTPVPGWYSSFLRSALRFGSASRCAVAMTLLLVTLKTSVEKWQKLLLFSKQASKNQL